MKALVWESPRNMVLREQPEPTVGSSETLVRVAYVGICGSELSAYLGQNALRVPPLVMGHEFSGEVAALGSEARSQNPDLVEGQRVTVNPLLSCGECIACRSGHQNLCPHRRLIGAARPGAFAEYVSVPARSVVPLPDEVSLRAGALMEPTATAVRIGEMIGPLTGKNALVVGAGAIGLLALDSLRMAGADRRLITDIVPGRLRVGGILGGTPIDASMVDVAEAVGQATSGRYVHASVDAVGSEITRRQCVLSTSSAGVVILVGLHEERSTLPIAEIIRREISVRGCFAYSPANFDEALSRVTRVESRLDPWIVEVQLSEGGEWFNRMIDVPGGVVKVLLVARI